MQTSLPDLPFPTTAIDVSLHRGSNPADTGPQAFPKTDLKTLQPWPSFASEIEDTIHAKMAAHNTPNGTQLQVGSLRLRRRRVNCEEALRSHAHVELHEAVQDVVNEFGIDGSFELPASRSVALVGEPDFSWVSGDPASTLHPKLVVEYVPNWVAGLEDLPAFFAKMKHRRNGNQKQSVYALEQVYGYMVFNNCKYGVLSNWTRAWFLRRDASTGTHSKMIECAGPVEVAGSPGMPSMLKAFVGMVLLTERDAAADAPPPPRFLGSSDQLQKQAMTLAGNYDVAPIRGSYPLLPLDLRLCDFDFGSGPYSRSVRTKLSRDALNQAPLEVVCKIADIIHTPKSRTAFKNEAKMYAVLRDLQGDVIPRLYGYYEVWGILHVLALEPVGEAISEDRVITPTLRDKMKAALARVHAAGFIHGDIARRNFCEQGDKIYIIDLERSRRSKGEWETAAEMECIHNGDL